MPRREITLCSPSLPKPLPDGDNAPAPAPRLVRPRVHRSHWQPSVPPLKSCRACRPADGVCVLAAVCTHHSLSAPFFRRFHRLAVENGNTGARSASHLLAQLIAQVVMKLLPDAGLAPTTKVAIDRIPRRKVVGQHPPTVAGA